MIHIIASRQFSQDFLGTNIILHIIANKLFDGFLTNLGQATFIANSKDETFLLMLIPTVNLSMSCRKIPGQRIALTRVAASTSFKVYIIELLRDTNITLKLRYLEGIVIAFSISKCREHNLRVFNRLAVIQFRNQVIQLLEDTLKAMAHGASHIQSNDDRRAIRVFVTITRFSRYILRTESFLHISARIKRINCRTRTIPPSRSISSPTTCSPTTRTHNINLLYKFRLMSNQSL